MNALRIAFRSLTSRGRAFLSAGATALVCAVLVGLDDLGRIGVLLLALPLLSVVLVTRSRHRLGLVRTVEPGRIAAGQAARVTLALSNEGRSPTGLLLLEEQVPYTLGERPRFVIDRMGAGWHRRISYELRPELRGRYPVGPLTVRLHDPFGLVQVDRTFTSSTHLVVTPRVVDLPAITLSGVWTGSGDNRPRDFAGGSAEDVTVREYRRGDDLRRVHWRASAHAGELMVRREEQPWQSRATIFLDNRVLVHRGTGPRSSLEYAVSLAASTARHLVQRGFRVRLVTADGVLGGQNWHEHGAVSTEFGPLLDALAVLGPADRVACETTWLNDAHQVGVLIGLWGEVTEADRPLLRQMHRAARRALGVSLEVERWEGRAGGSGEQVLASEGWRAVVAGPADPMPQVWQHLGRAARRDPSLAGPAGGAR